MEAAANLSAGRQCEPWLPCSSHEGSRVGACKLAILSGDLYAAGVSYILATRCPGFIEVKIQSLDKKACQAMLHVFSRRVANSCFSVRLHFALVLFVYQCLTLPVGDPFHNARGLLAGVDSSFLFQCLTLFCSFLSHQLSCDFAQFCKVLASWFSNSLLV